MRVTHDILASVFRRNFTETVARVRAYILADPDIVNDKTKFVEGWGWDHTKWLLEEWPTYVRPPIHTLSTLTYTTLLPT